MIQEYREPKHTLVATLGGQPQIVTFTLDLLLRRSIPIHEVIVVHPAASPLIQQSLARLNAEFVGDRYVFEGQNLTIRFRSQVLNHYGTIIDDIVDENTANGTLDTIGELIRSLKQQRRIIHFSISGGRRLMTFLSFSAALLYFETPDELLHLYTPDAAKVSIDYSGVMHVPPESGQRLIEVPFARAAQPFFASLLNRTHSVATQTELEKQKEEEDEKSEKGFDVFLCYSHENKLEVKKIGEQLKERGIIPWLDEWELRPGTPWQSVLENQIPRIKSAAVFIGKGMNPWEHMEQRAFLREFVKRGLPVIPVLLPECDKANPELPAFLKDMIWVDFRQKDPNPLEALTWGITGRTVVS